MHIQLFIDEGMGIFEQGSIKYPVAFSHVAQEFIFDLSARAGLRALRLDPLDDSTVLDIEQIALIRNNGDINLIDRIHANAHAIQQQRYIFETDDPQLYFTDLDQRELATAQALRVQIRYAGFGKRILDPDVFDKLLPAYQAGLDKVAADSVLVGNVFSVKAWCQQTAAPYHSLSPTQTIEIASPNFIGKEVETLSGQAQTNELYVAELRQARIISKCDVVIVNADTVLYDNLTHSFGATIDLHYEDAIKYQSPRKLLIDYSDYQTIFAESGIYLAGVTSHHFGHWYLEHLPKMMQLDAIPAYQNYPLYVDEGMPISHYQCLELMVGGKRSIIKIGAKTTILFDTLIVASTYSFCPYHCWPDTTITADFGPTSAGFAAYLRDKLLPAVGLDATPWPANQTGRRIFIGRNLINVRKLTNELEIQTFLARFGFEVIYPELLDFEQQIRIFNAAEYVIGPGGSAFFNAYFCKQGTKLIIFGKSHVITLASWLNAFTAIGLQHLFVVGETASAGAVNLHTNYQVPLELVEQALAYYGIDN